MRWSSVCFQVISCVRSFSGSRHVSHHLLVIHGLEDVVLAGAVVVAGAGLDEHHVLLHDLSVRAFELHGQGGGSVGGAAAAIQADAAELWPVGLGGGAAGDLELHGLGESGSADALFAFPDALLQLGLAWSHHTQPGLFLQAAFAVIIGDPGGDPKAASLRAGAPFSSLNQAVLPHHGEIRAIGLFLSVGSQSRAHEAVSVGRITRPLLAAFPWHLDTSRHGAVWAGQPDVHGAKRDTTHSSIQTGTLVLAAALESLSALVNHASEHTGGSLPSCAHSNVSVDGGSVVTVEAFVWVADVFISTELPHLLGAHPAAAAAVQHQAHSWGALRGSGGARTLVAALLTCSHV